MRLRLVLIGLGALAACESDIQSPDEDRFASPVALDRMNPDQRYHGLAGGLEGNGQPVISENDGRIVIVAISMSNGSLEFGRFIDQYSGHPDVHPRIGLVNCARGGNALESWLAESSLWEDCRAKIVAAGFDVRQVRVVWAKNANQFTSHGRTLPDPAADYHDLVRNIAELSRRIAVELPDVQAVFHSSRIYGGYSANPGRGEPMSYEGGLAVNAVIAMHRRGELAGAPWIGWGPYLWSNGAEPNGAGLYWTVADYAEDRVHPSPSGQMKVAVALHNHFLQYDWYRR